MKRLFGYCLGIILVATGATLTAEAQTFNNDIMATIMADSNMHAHYTNLINKYPLIVENPEIWYKMDQAIIRINAMDDEAQFKIKRKLMLMETRALDRPLLRQFINYLQDFIGKDVESMHLHHGTLINGSFFSTKLTITENAMRVATLSSLVSSLKATELSNTLNSTSNTYTVFAPTNNAFTNSSNGSINTWTNTGLTQRWFTGGTYSGDLKNILMHHVVSGKYTKADLYDGLVLTTLQGDTLTVRIMNGQIKIDGALITTSDIVSQNGVIHMIDTVLMPRR